MSISVDDDDKSKVEDGNDNCDNVNHTTGPLTEG